MATSRNIAKKRPIKKTEVQTAPKTAVNDIVQKINTLHEQTYKTLSQIVDTIL